MLKLHIANEHIKTLKNYITKLDSININYYTITTWQYYIRDSIGYVYACLAFVCLQAFSPQAIL